MSRSLDREDIAVYSLLIIAEDSAGNNGSTTVRISLTDINDKAPEFQQTEYMAFVKENSAVGTPVLPVSGNATITIQAIDEDQPNTPNSRVMYQLEGANAVRFNIDPASGIVTVARGSHYIVGHTHTHCYVQLSSVNSLSCSINQEPTWTMKILMTVQDWLWQLWPLTLMPLIPGVAL